MYVIKSISEDGTYYMVKNWRKNKAIWNRWICDKTIYKTESAAKGALTKLLKIMDEYKTDIFYLLKVDEFGYVINEIQISVI